MKLYNTGDILGEDEYLLKIRSDNTGFLTKLTKKGELPKSFIDWNDYSPHRILPIHIVKEIFTSGWKLESWRFGTSQNWATIWHPMGFKVEIYLSDFLRIIQKNDIHKGELIGAFKWQENKLIKHEL